MCQSSLHQEYDELTARIRESIQTTGRRPETVHAEICETGYYTHTPGELLAGCKVAWRNHARCNGRMHWRSLQVRDCREADSTDEVFAECVNHLVESTNGGALRAMLTVFRATTPHNKGFSILNPQLVRYAGYRNPDGSVTGDPLHLGITSFAIAMGWKPQGSQFDVLPLLIKDPLGSLTLREFPPGVVKEVNIHHPEYPGIAELGLRWHANPAVCDMTLSLGGIDFPLVPFSGWYVASEIGARNLSDLDRYNQLPAVARAMGLHTDRDSTMWKDRAVVELTYAVQHSFEQAGVHIVDHHRAAEQFLRHRDRELQLGRDTPTDWSWINPPISASTTPTFHRTYDPPDFDRRPNFIPREPVSAPKIACPFSGSGETSDALATAR